MPGWTKWRELVSQEFTQSIEEGRDPRQVEALRAAWKRAGDDPRKLRRVWEQVLAVQLRRDFPYDEPSDLAGIRKLRPRATRRPRKWPLQTSASSVESWTDAQLYDRMYGAWLGRCVGCALGKPVEGFMGPHDGLSSKDRIKMYLQAIGPREWPLRGYFPEHSPAEGRTGKLWCQASTREHIEFMETDDDIRYTVLGQIILQEHGRGFTTWDVAHAWVTHLPFRMLCTAESQAYRNLTDAAEFHAGKGSDATTDWTWIAAHENPYREWIGAQIRADSWGYGAPGDPELAAKFAWRDARLSHVKNGIYGEMFVAAMIAAAFALDNPRKIVQAGLAEIPRTSRLYDQMQQVIKLCDKHGHDAANFEAVLDGVYDLLGHYHAVHTNNNAGLVVAALLLSGGAPGSEFENGVTIAVMGGWDTDCNGATVGSILGAMLGAKRLPKRWTAPLHNTLNSELIGYHPIAISECARRSVAIARKVLGG